MSLFEVQEDTLARSEYSRLNKLAQKYEPKMRLAYTRAVSNGLQVNRLHLRNVITEIMIETAITTANVYDMTFNPNSFIYADQIDELTDLYSSFADSTKAKEEVRRIIPMGIPVSDMRRRLALTFGLDARSALSVERYRQQRGDGLTAARDVERARKAAILERGNRLATTETNRVINATIETLAMDNAGILKVEYIVYSSDYVRDMRIQTRKEWVTRGDTNVCKVCRPLAGLTINTGNLFEGKQGYFQYPPAHPLCRCKLILRA